MLDDFFIAEAPPRRHCMTSLCKILCLLADLNIPVAPRKTFPASTTLEFLGIRLDSDNMTASLSEDKYERLKVDLSSWLTKKVLHLKRVTIFDWNPTVCMPSCCPRTTFSSTHYSSNQGVARFSHHIKLNTSFRKDIAMWQIFLDHWNGSNFFLQSKTTQSPDLHFFTDASGSLGYGAFFNNQWFQGQWLPKYHSHTEQQSIAWKELFPIYLACMIWGSQWSGKHFLHFE